MNFYEYFLTYGYTFKKELGRGGFGTVLKVKLNLKLILQAKHNVTNQKYAIKLIYGIVNYHQILNELIYIELFKGKKNFC